MSWKVWKDPLERAAEELQKGYLKGLNLADWNTAYSSFNSAFDLYSKAGDRANADLARALCLFSRALANPNVDENWTNAGAALNYTGLPQINITTDIPTKDIAQECNLKAIELRNRKAFTNLERAALLEDTAKQYLAFGGKSLMIPLLLQKQQITGTAMAHIIIAEAAILRGDAELDSDPKHASEFYRMAAIHMKTAGNVNSSAQLSRKAEDFAATALCYFCGREVIGKEINFVYMKAQVTRYIEKQNAAKVLPSTSGNMVVACKVCHSAITIAADDIARAYFDQVQRQIQRLEAEIANLNGRINNLSARVG